MVMILSWPLLISEIAAYSVVVLPLLVTGHQQHAVGCAGKAVQRGDRCIVKTEISKAQAFDLVCQGLLVEYAQYRVFAKNAGHDGHAKIHFVAAHRHFEATVLRHAALGDVEFRHHLDAGNHLLRQLQTVHRAYCGEHPVDAVLDAQTRWPGFEVDVAGSDFQRVVYRRVHQLDHRAGVFADGLEREFIPPAPCCRSLCVHRQQAVHGVQCLLVARQVSRHVAAMCEAPGETAGNAMFRPHLQRNVERVAHDQDQAAVIIPQRNALALE
jgi:hypothetical protein